MRHQSINIPASKTLKQCFILLMYSTKWTLNCYDCLLNVWYLSYILYCLHICFTQNKKIHMLLYSYMLNSNVLARHKSCRSVSNFHSNVLHVMFCTKHTYSATLNPKQACKPCSYTLWQCRKMCSVYSLGLWIYPSYHSAMWPDCCCFLERIQDLMY